MSIQAPVLAPVRQTFRAVAETVVPEAASLDADGWAQVEGTIEHALAARPEALRRQLVTFLRLIELAPLLRHRGTFRRLDPARREAFLRSLESSRLVLVRRGFWGLRTLVMMGYYTLPSVQEALGYRAHPDGWSARRRSGEHAAVAPSPSASASTSPPAGG